MSFLTFAPLFPERLPATRQGGGYASSHSKIPARDLLEVISEETSVVYIVASDLLARRNITEADWQRLSTAVARIWRARDHGR